MPRRQQVMFYFNQPMLSSLLIIPYTFLLIALLYRITRRDRAFLSHRQVAVSFIVKIVFGLLYGYLFMRFYNGDDTWQYHERSVEEYQKLLHHPLDFIREPFLQRSGSLSLEAAASTTNSFWSDFEEVIFVRMLAIFDVFSFGNYYVNVVLFCFVAYLGHLLFFRLLTSYFPASTMFLFLGVFFYPTVLFWLSGIRKEGLLFLALATVLYYFNKLLLQHKSTVKNLLLFVAGMVTLWLIRNLVVLCLAPALPAWYIYQRYRSRLPGLIVFAAVYCFFAVLFFWSDSIPGLPDLAQKVTERQHSFLELKGNFRIGLDSLHGTARSFAQVLPQALNHSFLRPYITESRSALQMISALDIFLFFGFAAIALFYNRGKWLLIISNPVVLACLFTAFAGYLIIGYIVPFPGAFVRYKSLFELLFVACIASGMNKPSTKIKKMNILGRMAH